MYEIGQEYDNAPTPPIMPSTSKSFNGPSLMFPRTNSPIQPTNDSIHSIGYLPQVESGFEHDPHEKDEDREPQHFMGYEQIDDLVLVASFILFCS